MLNFHCQNVYPTKDALTNFLKDKKDPDFPDLIFTSAPRDGNRYPIRILVIGIPEGVTSVIYELYMKQFAEVNVWSLPLNARYPGEIIKLMTKYVVI